VNLKEQNRKAVKDFIKYHKKRLEIKTELEKENKEYTVDLETISHLEELKEFLQEKHKKNQDKTKFAN